MEHFGLGGVVPSWLLWAGLGMLPGAALAVRWGRRARAAAATLAALQARQEAERAERRAHDLREAEARRLGGIGYWEVDAATRAVRWSDEAEAVFALAPAAGPPSLDALLAAIHPEDCAQVEAALTHALATGAPCALEARLLRPDGEVRHVDARGQAVTDAEGRVVRLVGTLRDTTEREQRELQLRLLSSAVQQLGSGVLITDAEERIVFANPAFEAMTGWRLDEVLGRRPATFLQGPATDPAARAQLRAAIDERRATKVELVNYTRSGQPYWIELHVAPVFDPDGVCTHYVAVEVDVTDRREAMSALSGLTAKLQAVMRASPVAIVTLDLDGRVLSWNPAAEQLFHWRATELIGRPLPTIPPEEAGRAQALVAQAAAGQQLRDIEVRRVRRDGTPVEAAVSLAPIRDAEGRVTGVMKSYLDLTERKRQHAVLQRLAEELRAVVECAPVAIATVQPDGTVMSWNPAAEGLFGWTEDDVLGRPLPIVQGDPELAAEARALWQRVLGGERIVGHDTFRYRRDGSRIDVALSAAPLRNALGRAEQVMLVYVDVTERRQAERELQHYYGEVELARELAERQAHEMADLAEELRGARNAAVESARLKSEFLANMSHEIRTPMNAIIGFSELLLEMELGDTQREFVDTVRGAADSLLHIINDILDFSKIEAGQLRLEEVPFDLRGAVEGIGELLAPRAQAKGLEFILRVAPEAPTHLVGDEVRLRQVLLNLVGNALKFTERGHVLVDVTGRAVEGRGELAITVEDSGIGIAAEKLDSIFGKFMQADGSTSRRFGGTGLGLAICRQLAELMGGDVAVASVEGEGSRFTFTAVLPLDPAQPRPARGAAPARRARVLVVDDHAVTRRVLEEQLGALGLAVSVVADGTAALAALREAVAAGDPFSAALVDWLMPGMNGIEVARAVRADPALAGLSLCAVTGAADRLEAERCLGGEFDVVYLKPMRHQQLAEVAARALEVVAVRQQQQRPARPLVDGAQLHGLRILLVEDNPVNQRMATVLLERLGCRVVHVPNGAVAVERALAGGHDVVLMDCHMPVMDGYEATRAIRQAEGAGPRLPIIAMTASAMQGDREQCLACGMDDYVSKPVRREDLVAALERWRPAGARAEAAA